MALTLTSNATLESQKVNLTPQIVLKIDGVSTLFGAVEILRFIRIGDPERYIDSSWVIGGKTAQEDQEDLISFDGSSQMIQQQLHPDKGSVSSVSSVLISVVDKNNVMTRLISPGVEIADMLGRKAKLYLGFADIAYPEDYVEIFSGIIDDIESLAGKVNLNIAHPEQKKRQEIFVKATTKLNGALTSSATTIPVDSTSDFVFPVLDAYGAFDTAIKHYIRIDDEIIQYAGNLLGSFTGCTRGALGTTAAAHDDNAEVESFYVLEGNCIDLALKIMLSGKNGPFVENVAVTSFLTVPGEGTVTGAIFFKGIDLEGDYGLHAGDSFTTTGATIAQNDISQGLIDTIVKTSEGSYLITSNSIVFQEDTTSAVCSFRSKYDTLGVGLGLTPDQVDVAEHIYWRDLVLAGFSYRVYLKDTINGKEFIDKELYAPFGAYSIPRKGKCSVGYHIGPIPRGDITFIDKHVVKNPGKIKLRRTINKNFYNTIVYAFDEYTLEEKFLAGNIYTDADSKSRIPVGNRVLRFNAKGIRTDLDGPDKTDIASRRLLGRYKLGAEHFESIEIFFKTGFPLEPGDLVVFDPDGLQISNTEDGTRVRPEKFFEVVNKKLDIKTGAVSISLVDTNFDTSERYGIISPSSKIVSGSTSYAIIEDSFEEVFQNDEPKKWANYVGKGLNVLVHDENFTFSEEIEVLGFDPVDRYKMLFNGDLSQPVQAGWIIDIPNYPTTTNKEDNRLYKLFHGFHAPEVSIVSGVSATEFTVGASDASKFFVGATITVHSADFSQNSGEVKVTAVSGTTITCGNLGFTPDNADTVSFIGFADSTSSYRII